MAKICRRCGEQLESVTFYVHHERKLDLEWLVEDRKATSRTVTNNSKHGDELDIDEVLERLIQLELNKRIGMAEARAKKAARANKEGK